MPRGAARGDVLGDMDWGEETGCRVGDVGPGGPAAEPAAGAPGDGRTGRIGGRPGRTGRTGRAPNAAGPLGTRCPICTLGARPWGMPGRTRAAPGPADGAGRERAGIDMRAWRLGCVWPGPPGEGRGCAAIGGFQLVRPVADSTYTCRLASESLQC